MAARCADLSSDLSRRGSLSYSLWQPPFSGSDPAVRVVQHLQPPLNGDEGAIKKYATEIEALRKKVQLFRVATSNAPNKRMLSLAVIEERLSK